MKLLLWALGLALLAALAAVALQGSQGTIVALVPPYRVDLSVNLVVLVGVLLLWIAYRLGRALQRLSDFPERVRAYRERRAEIGAQRGLREALRALLEGRFARAERAARSARSTPSIAGLAALIGARAAHRMQEFERREQWLDRASAYPELSTARLVSAAEMWAEQRQNARALAAIEEMHAAGARHIHAMRIALAAHLQAGHWDDAIRIIRALDKHRGLRAAASNSFKLVAYRGLLREAAADPATLERQWTAIAEADRLLPELSLEAARLFNSLGQGQLAARALEAALQERWDERLLDEYGRCKVDNPRLALERAEGWLRQHARSAALLRCLGRICLREQLWGKARAYLDESHRLAPDPESALALAELAEAIGEGEAAAGRFREAAIGLARRANAVPRSGIRSIARESSL
jgi:HemY protein